MINPDNMYRSLQAVEDFSNRSLQSNREAPEEDIERPVEVRVNLTYIYGIKLDLTHHIMLNVRPHFMVIIQCLQTISMVFG